MTQAQFIAKCEELTVAPELALENDLIVRALQSKNDALVIELLETQFELTRQAAAPGILN